jgi:hypothetical protein
MNVESLAQQLLAFSDGQGAQQDLIVRAGPEQDLYFRFSSDRQGSPPAMSWEARPRSVGAETRESAQQAEWLARMDFQKDGEGLVGRTVAMPFTIEAARLIAGLASFLLERAYDLPDKAVVSVALEIPTEQVDPREDTSAVHQPEDRVPPPSACGEQPEQAE